MTSVWVAEHGWCYLNAAIDCCTREITGWALDIRCRKDEAIAVIEQAIADRGVRPGMLTLGTDNGSAYTSRQFRARLTDHGITHRRRLPRPREPGVHRELVLQAQAPLRLARGVRDHRAGPPHDRRLHRHLPPPAPLRAQLPNAARGRGNLAGSPRRPNPGGLN